MRAPFMYPTAGAGAGAGAGAVGAAIMCQHRIIRVAWPGMTTPPGPQVKRCFVLQCCIRAAQLWPRGELRVYTEGHSRQHHRSQAHTHRQRTHSDAGASLDEPLVARRSSRVRC
jgi:hypothetical protein